MRILVSGGLGYIGSHTVVALVQTGHEVVIIDNLANSELSVLRRLDGLCGREPMFHLGDVRDIGFLRRVLARHRFDCAVHFAGLKAVADSVCVPLDYYDVNVTGSLCLLRSLNEACVRRIVFSSSATVYGDPATVPITESHPVMPVNPYGRSKAMVEQMLDDLCHAEPDWSAISLRYFNPAGAHPTGSIGEQPNGVPNNLMPYLSQVGSGNRERLRVFGDNYPTRDGTGERDYVHVMDLADAHVRAVELTGTSAGHDVINIGTGRGHTVLEVVRAYEAAIGGRIRYEIAPPRAGDIASCYADAAYAHKRLNWRARRDLDQMCQDAARFERLHAHPEAAKAAIATGAT